MRRPAQRPRSDAAAPASAPALADYVGGDLRAAGMTVLQPSGASGCSVQRPTRTPLRRLLTRPRSPPQGWRMRMCASARATCWPRATCAYACALPSSAQLTLTLSRARSIILLLKMYLASPVSTAAAAAAAAAAASGAPPVPAHTFLFARGDEKHALYGILGAAASGQESELLPGVEAGLAGMRAGGRRKIVVPPKGAYGEHGISHKTGMRNVVVPPNATLLFYVEVLRAGHYSGATRDHDEL